MCRQIFIAQKIEGVGSDQELEELQKLVDGHKANRERVGGEEEYEAFDG